MQKVTILAVGKIKTDYWAQAAAEYAKRLKPFIKLEMKELPAISFSNSDKEKAKRDEGETIISALAKYSGSQIYILAEQGQQYSSTKFSQLIFTQTLPVVLVIGGTQGISEEVLKKFPNAKKLSLSAMTLPHELTRVVLLEQLYRAATIDKKMSYHY